MTGTRRRTTSAYAVVALVAALLAGCSAGSDSDATAAAPAAAAGGADSGGSFDEGAAADSKAAAPETAPRSAAAGAGGTVVEQAAVAPRSVIVTVGRTVRVPDVSAAVASAGTTARTLGGRVESEDGTQDPDDPGASRQVSVLRVPPAQVETLVTEVEALGEVLRRTRQDTDVTAKHQDVTARLANARASVARVREFYAEAEGVREVVLMEGELSKRVADLESLQAQYDALADVTTLATVTVTFVGSGTAVVEDEDDSGFLGGLRAGWSGLVGLLVVAATVLGAVLPFVPLVVLALLLGLWGRRTVRRRAARPVAGSVAGVG